MTCKQCGAALEKDEIAVYRRIVNRNAEEILCIPCFAKAYGVTEELIQKKIRHFKSLGCTLFENSVP